MKRPNGIVPKSARGVWAYARRSVKGMKPRDPVTKEEIMSIKLGIVPGGDRKRDPTKKLSKADKKLIRILKPKAKTRKQLNRELVALAEKRPVGKRINYCRDPEKLNPTTRAKAQKVGEPKPRVLPDLSKKPR